MPDVDIWFPSGVLINADISDEPYVQMYSDYVFEFLIDGPLDVIHELSCFVPDLIDNRITLDAPDCTLGFPICSKHPTELKHLGGLDDWHWACKTCWTEYKNPTGWYHERLHSSLGSMVHYPP